MKGNENCICLKTNCQEKYFDQMEGIQCGMEEIM
jgi:hypothetical protein